MINQTPRLNIGIIGARGYSGLELVKTLLLHPFIKDIFCFSDRSDWNIFLENPLFLAHKNKLKHLPLNQISTSPIRFLFLATPAEASLEFISHYKDRFQIIDLSGAMRLSFNLFKQFYPADSQNISETGYKNLQSDFSYGICPFQKTKAKHISNPGCYVTSALLPLIPLLKEDLIESNSIIIDAKSGTSGGGKKASEALLHAEITDNYVPYKIGNHQHQPEIETYAEHFSGKKTDLVFTTSLIPIKRGILSTIYLKLKPGKKEQHIQSAFENAFKGYHLVHFSQWKPQAAQIAKVAGTPFTQITWHVDGQNLIIFSALDNLLKGAATQAVENMNLQLNLPAECGLIYGENL